MIESPEPTWPAPDHHTSECDAEYRHTSREGCRLVRAWWCATHGQWAYDFGKPIRYEFSDGSTLEVKR